MWPAKRESSSSCSAPPSSTPPTSTRLEEQIEEGEFTREEQREYQARIRKLRVHKGATCSLELAFDFNSRLYVYDVQPDWYDEFCDLDEEIVARTADSDADDDDSLGGFYSKN